MTKEERKASRKAKLVELLVAVREGRPHTMANKVIAPLVSGDLLAPTYADGKLISVALTVGAEVWLSLNEVSK